MTIEPDKVSFFNLSQIVTDDKSHKLKISLPININFPKTKDEDEQNVGWQEMLNCHLIGNSEGVNAANSEDIPLKAAAKKLGKGFLNKLKQTAKRLNCDYNDLLAVINSECSLNPYKSNGIGAVGLIQFTKPTIDQYNKTYKPNPKLTKERITKMSAIEQLTLVENALKMNMKIAGIPEGSHLSAGTLYALIFLPGRAGNNVLCKEGEVNPKTGKLLKYYEQNQGLDVNNDGKITKSDLAERLKNKRVDVSYFV